MSRMLQWEQRRSALAVAIGAIPCLNRSGFLVRSEKNSLSNTERLRRIIVDMSIPTHKLVLSLECHNLWTRLDASQETRSVSKLLVPRFSSSR